jgi:hydrogenase expression/formation protein HypD
MSTDLQLSKNILAKIKAIAAQIPENITIMHVCGTHEYVIAKNSLRELLPKNVKVISGPGCPVCVCPTSDIDLAIELAKKPNIILTTFGDMMRVPSSSMSMYEAKARGMDVRVVYGPHDAVELAENNPDKEVVFFAIGFETTAPLIAFEILNNPPPNFSVICAHKVVPPAMELLLTANDQNIDGFLLPGHVSAIIGVNAYIPLLEKYNSPMVVGGFEVNDVLISILFLLRQIQAKEAKVENTYTRIVKPEGNVKAQEYLKNTFEVCDSVWRGIGMIKNGGYRIVPNLIKHDAVQKFGIQVPPTAEMPKGCSCDQVLLGKKAPQECPLFNTKCTPQNPVGPCMVSHEGSCKIAHMFQKYNLE